MRTFSVSTTAGGNLLELHATPPEIDQINAAVNELAVGTKAGYPVPLQSPFLGVKKKLYQYPVGRFKLNYTLTKTELVVASVLAA
jgi:hypothetical protein